MPINIHSLHISCHFFISIFQFDIRSAIILYQCHPISYPVHYWYFHSVLTILTSIVNNALPIQPISRLFNINFYKSTQETTSY